MCRSGGYKERKKPEGGEEAAGRGMLAGRAESVSSGRVVRGRLGCVIMDRCTDISSLETRGSEGEKTY